MRVFISQNAYNKSTIYGLFYGGVAISTSIGAVITGFLWKSFGEDIAIYFSLIGAIFILILLSYYKTKKGRKHV